MECARRTAPVRGGVDLACAACLRGMETMQLLAGLQRQAQR